MNFIGLFPSKNYLNRREFITNYLIVQLLILIFNSIYGWFSFAVIMFSKNLILQKNYSSEITAFAEALIEFLFLKTSIEKRVADIIGEDSQNKVWIISFICNFFAIFALRYLAFAIEHKYYESYFFSFIISLVCIIIWLVLFCKSGKQSSVDINPEIKFNWGAFWGTWIWGIINKIKITQLFFPLVLINPSTIFNFSLICGLKGNEWILSQNTEDDTENLHKNQKRQAWILFFLIPIMSITLLLATSKILRHGDNYNIFSTKLNKIITLVTQKTTNTTFERIEYVDGQYNFHIDIEFWNSMTQEERIKLYELVVHRVLSDKDLNYSQLIPVEIINNINIYDSKNNYRLFYCQIPESYKYIPNKNYKLKNFVRKYSRDY